MTKEVIVCTICAVQKLPRKFARFKLSYNGGARPHFPFACPIHLPKAVTAATEGMHTEVTVTPL